MVKPDAKHNYYADLELPPSSSIDDIRKAYRKLALQYHPDRNTGREAECVPKFQAIQAAHEVLGDPAVKAKYDQDRRKEGFSSPFKPNANTPGNPYAATSNFPPPPRRTQPGTWQRPAPTAGPQAAGAGRFSNFPRPSNASPRKDPAAGRTEQFRAWQKMNNGPERQRSYNETPSPPRPPPAPGRSTASRQDANMPSEEQIRAGMNYRKPPGHSPEDAEQRKSAWQAFQQQKQGESSTRRKSTFRTPRKPGGFDPSAPGSDERPAPDAGSHYGHRHRSEDFGTPVNGSSFPPPPPGPPPASPTSRRPSTDFSNQSKNTDGDNDAPYSEGNRTSSPYASPGGEKTKFSSESLRRSASTRNATKWQTDGSTTSRAKSNSPPRRQVPNAGTFTNGATSSSDNESSSDDGSPKASNQKHSTFQNTNLPSAMPSAAEPPPQPSQRPKKKPVPRNRRFNSNLENPTQADRNGPFNDIPSQDEHPDMKQRPSSQNMYATPNSFPQPQTSHFNRDEWVSTAFGTSENISGGGPRRLFVPPWAMPGSVCPRSSSQSQGTSAAQPPCHVGDTPSELPNCHAGERLSMHTSEVKSASISQLHREAKEQTGAFAARFVKEEYLRDFASQAQRFHVPDHLSQNSCPPKTQPMPVSSCATPSSPDADHRPFSSSFTFPIYADTFTPTASKSRSEENISTTFSPDGWNGTFTGAPDYFAPPATGRKASPARRSSQKPTQRMPPAERSYSTGMASTSMPPPPRPSDAGNSQQSATTEAADQIKFSKQDWEKTFQDPSWTWPPPPPNPPTEAKKPNRSSGTERKTQRQAMQDAPIEGKTSTGTKENPHVVDDDHAGFPRFAAGHAPQIDDAMDIDSTPPVPPSRPQQETPLQSQTAKEPRLYSVPPSNWRQAQQAQQTQSEDGHSNFTNPTTTSAAANTGLNTSLEDLTHVEPFNFGAKGLHGVAELESSLPFPSKAATTLPIHPLEAQKLQTPPVPKAPEVPHNLTKSSWHAYSLAFGAYLQAFHAFNKTMLTHLDAREHAAQFQMQNGMSWLEATGDTSGKLAEPSGFGIYLKGVCEDEHVREVWNVGFERHAEAVKGFDKIRERVRYLVNTNQFKER